MIPEDLHAGVRQESRKNENYECQDRNKTRISLQEMLVFVMSRYLKNTSILMKHTIVFKYDE
jgi:hypothetical protein